MTNSEKPSFDNSAEIIAAHVDNELTTYLGQTVTPALINVVHEGITARIGGIVGMNETSEILGVSKQRATQLMDPGAKQIPPPSPIARVRATTIWLKAEVENYQLRRKQRE
jgi:hypothetical protein